MYKGEITLKEADEDHSNLLIEIINFKNKIKPQNHIILTILNLKINS